MKYDSIKTLPKGLVDDVAKFLKGGVVEEVEELDEARGVDHQKMVEKLKKQIEDHTDKLGLAKEKRKMRNSYHKSAQGDAEMKISKKISDLSSQLDFHQRALKESAECLDEISKGTLGSYAKKAIDQAGAFKAGADSLEKAASDYRSKELADTAGKMRSKQFNRTQGAKKAIDKLTKEGNDLDDYLVIDEDFNVGIILDIVNENLVEIMFDDEVRVLALEDVHLEEVEQLDEVSKETLQSYTQKAKADPAFEKKKGKPSKITVAVRAKREKGLASAKEKLQAILRKESDAHHKEMSKLANKTNDHFHKESHKILEKHGFNKVASGPGVDTYIHPHENGHISTISIARGNDDAASYGSAARATNSKGSSWGAHYAHSGIWDGKSHEKHMNEMMPKFENHVIDVKNNTDSPHSW